MRNDIELDVSNTSLQIGDQVYQEIADTLLGQTYAMMCCRLRDGEEEMEKEESSAKKKNAK